MAITKTDAVSILDALHVFAVPDNRLFNMINQYYTDLRPTVLAAAVRVNAIVHRYYAGPIAQGVFAQDRFNAAKKVLDYVNAGANAANMGSRIDQMEFVHVTLGLPEAALNRDTPDTTQLRQALPHLTQNQRTSINTYIASRAVADTVKTVWDSPIPSAPPSRPT